jgi:hypothetical protein
LEENRRWSLGAATMTFLTKLASAVAALVAKLTGTKGQWQ